MFCDRIYELEDSVRKTEVYAVEQTPLFYSFVHGIYLQEPHLM